MTGPNTTQIPVRIGTWNAARARGELRLPETDRADHLATADPGKYALLVAALRRGEDRDKLARDTHTSLETIQQVLDREGLPLYRERIRRNAAVVLDRLLVAAKDSNLHEKRMGTSIKDILIGAGILSDKFPSFLGEEAQPVQQHQVLRINLTASMDEIKAMLRQPQD